jgi:hypothetical protein
MNCITIEGGFSRIDTGYRGIAWLIGCGPNISTFPVNLETCEDEANFLIKIVVQRVKIVFPVRETRQAIIATSGCA